MLSVELSGEDKPPQTRKLAGLILKNALTAKVFRLESMLNVLTIVLGRI
jgi:hypothetical protein